MESTSFTSFTKSNISGYNTDTPVGISVIQEWTKPNLPALFLLLIPTLTIVGNLLVIMSVWRERTLKTATNYLIVSMALADLLVAFLVMPFAVYVEVDNGFWRLPRSLCTAYTALDVCASTASILNLVAISWDRYMAVSKPIEYSRSHQKNKRVLIAIILVWIFSIIVSLPIMTGFNRLDDTPYCEFTNAVFIIASSFASFCLPCVVMVALYSVVLHKLRKRQLQIRATRAKNQYSRATSTKKSTKRTANTSLSMASADRSIIVAISPLHRRCNHDCITSPEPTESTFKIDSFISNDFTNQPTSVNISISLTSPTWQEQNGNLPHSEEASSDDDEEDIGSECPSNYIPSNQGSHTALPVNGSHLSIDRSRYNHSVKELDSVPFIDHNPVDTKLSKRPRRPSAPVNIYNGQLKMPPSPSLQIPKKDICLSRTSMPEIKIDPGTVIGGGGNEKSRRNPFLKSISDARDIDRSGGESRMFDQLKQRLRKDSSRRDSNTSMGALALRIRDMKYASRQAIIRTTKRKAAASRYSKQCRKERKATYMLAVVLVVFLACWLPFFTCHMTNSVCIIRTGDTCINIGAFFMTTWLGYMNSFMNPVIYTIFNPEYRRAFKNILFCKRANRNRVIR